MASAPQLAAALLSRQDASASAADLLWERSGSDVGSAATPPSSPQLALKVAKSSLAAALALVPALTDPAALDLVARKDDRKRVRRLVALNSNTSRDTLLFLLGWSLRPRILDDELFEHLLLREELVWDDFCPVLASAEVLPSLRWYPVAQVVRRAASTDAYRSALRLQLRELSECFLRDVLDGSAEGLSFREFLSLAAPSVEERQHFLGTALTFPGVSMPLEVAELVVAELPVWSTFPSHAFLRSPSSLRALPPEVVEVFDAAGDPRADLVLAASRGVPESVQLRLAEDLELRLILVHHLELPLSVLEVLVEDPLRDGALYGRPTRVSAAPLMVGRPLPEPLASRLVERLAAGEFRANTSAVLAALKVASSSSRLLYLRKQGMWSLTKAYLIGSVGPVSGEEIRSLFADPGLAFSTHVPTGGYRNPETYVALTDRAEISQLFIPDLNVYGNLPWSFELLDELAGVLGSRDIVGSLSTYLWERLAPVRDSPHLLEAFLSLAPEWTGTLPELVEVVLLTA